MSASQLVGLAMLAAFLLGLFVFTARGMGAVEAIKAWTFAIVATAFVVVATALLTGK